MFNPLYIATIMLTLYLMTDWASLLLHTNVFKVAQKSINTLFFLSVAWLAVDFARWEGQAHIIILNLLDQAVRFLQHTQ